MKEIRKVRVDYNVLLRKLEDMAEIMSLYHDQPLTIERASEYLGIKKNTLYQWMHKSKIPYYKPAGKRVFFSRLELNKWAFIHKIFTEEELETKVNNYVLWGKRDWEYREYELIYKRKE